MSQCGLPGLVSPQRSSFDIVSELPVFLLRRLPSFLGQVVTLTSHANRFEAARHQGRRHWICHPCVNLPPLEGVFVHSLHSPTQGIKLYVFIHPSCCFLSIHCPRLPHTSKVKIKIQNPKIQKQKKAKRAMGREIPQGLDKVTAASQSQNQ